ncbi:MAG: threonine synthase, partial [Oscillospiraceae bacterium]|nr:threonine synthase [Oscillospiraceae bacterium]
MNYFSTRNKDASVSASRAILQGISEDGGLFVPERFPQVDLKALRQYDYAGLAAYLLGLYLTDYTPSFL